MPAAGTLDRKFIDQYAIDGYLIVPGVFSADEMTEAAVDSEKLFSRRDLIDNRLIAHQRPLYQVLALGPPQPSPRVLSSRQMQSSPRRPAPARPQPGGSADVQSTGPVPGNVEGPQSLARIFQLMAPGAAPDQPLDSPSRREKP